MRWGNKFGGESQNNSPPPTEVRGSNQSSSFTFTKKDDKSPNKNESKVITEETKFEELEIQECSPRELPSINVPKRFTSSCAGEVFDKHIDRINNTLEPSHQSRNSTCLPESQSHKASIVHPKVLRSQFKYENIYKSRKKPYSYKSNFQ